jgi:hypothetical protein
VGETIKRKRARQGDLTALFISFLFQLPGASPSADVPLLMRNAHRFNCRIPVSD